MTGPAEPSWPHRATSHLTWKWRRQRRAAGSSGPWRTAGTRPLRGRGLVGGGCTAPQAGQAPRSVPLHSPLPILHPWHSRSWSKCVSPSTPGTEHTNRAFRNVVHLLTRLRWPPTSFYEVNREDESKALMGKGQRQRMWPSGSSPGRSGRLGTPSSVPAPARPPPPTHGRRSRSYRHLGSHSRESKRP